MKITDLKCTVLGSNPVVRITTDEGIRQAEAAYEEQLKNPSPGVKRLMKIKAELEAQGYYSTQ